MVTIMVGFLGTITITKIRNIETGAPNWCSYVQKNCKTCFTKGANQVTMVNERWNENATIEGGVRPE